MAKRNKPIYFEELHSQQRRIFNFIKRFMHQHSYGPTMREIMTGLGITSTSVVDYHVNRLVEAGFLEKVHSISRGLRISDHYLEPPTSVSVPMLNEVVTNFAERVPCYGRRHEIPVEWLKGRAAEDVYALQVNTHLMYDAMVNDGDVVVLRRQNRLNDGEIGMVVLSAKNETRIRRLKYEGEWVYLEPLMSVMQPLRYRRDEVQVVGKVLGLMRQF
ncbi:MAG: repressor LexA [Chloroflexi bacterium]|nr:repressor LexA [Chloroflexota bacterium]